MQGHIWGGRDGYRGIFGEEGMDTGAYLGRQGWIQEHITDFEFENHKSVKKCITHTRASLGKYLFYGIPKLKF